MVVAIVIVAVLLAVPVGLMVYLALIRKDRDALPGKRAIDAFTILGPPDGGA